VAAFPSLCGPTHPNPSQLGGGWVIVEARSSDAAHHHSPSWRIALTHPGGVLGHCPVEKRNDSPTKHKPDSLQNAVVAISALNSK
jgi:hypothetical protein